jgi:hypothetical protein
MMLNRFVIIVAPVAGDKYNYRSQLAAFCRRRPSRLWVDGAPTASAYHTLDRAFLFARSVVAAACVSLVITRRDRTTPITGSVIPLATAPARASAA